MGLGEFVIKKVDDLLILRISLDNMEVKVRQVITAPKPVGVSSLSILIHLGACHCQQV